MSTKKKPSVPTSKALKPKTKEARTAIGTLPSSVTIRMYNVGFGDCFLLTFHYAKYQRHMLIDYGSTAAPKNAPKVKNYMAEVAEDIKKQCGDKLHIVVATHRHRDHISGFTKEGPAATGAVIASLEPDHVIQPWTEDPNAKVDAMSATASTYSQGKPDMTTLTAHFRGALADMDQIAGRVVKLAKSNPLGVGKRVLTQLRFLGEDNLKNLSAVDNLMEMGAKGTAYYVNAGMTLNRLLPGVRITVLGPPTLEQSETIRKQRSKDPSEFWQFRSFWAAQRLAMNSVEPEKPEVLFPNTVPVPEEAHDPSVRWFIDQARQIHADQTLELVRDLDSVLNNTSVIMLFEVGDRKLLFPGDAQIENWSYALGQSKWRALLKDVNLYKVGHHGSLNATPKSLWALFKNKGDDHKNDRLESLCSTKSGKHGSVQSGTEVPRAVLVKDLAKDSRYESTEAFKGDEKRCKTFEIQISRKVAHAR